MAESAVAESAVAEKAVVASNGSATARVRRPRPADRRGGGHPRVGQRESDGVGSEGWGSYQKGSDQWDNYPCVTRRGGVGRCGAGQ